MKFYSRSPILPTNLSIALILKKNTYSVTSFPQKEGCYRENVAELLHLQNFVDGSSDLVILQCYYMILYVLTTFHSDSWC